MMRLAEEGRSVALEGDVDAALLGMFGQRMGMGVGYVSDWLEHDERAITLWHPGHAPREFCVTESLELGRHFNNGKPLVVNAQLQSDQVLTLARIWRCDNTYHATAFTAITETARQPLLGAVGRAGVHERDVRELFERLCHAGMPHHITVFPGDHVASLRKLAERLQIRWFSS
jgi:hypothetical protein